MNPSTHLVTGATEGIGLQTALELGRKGARVLVHGRGEEKAAAACQQLLQAEPKILVEPVWGDFSRLDEVRALAAQVKAKAPALDVLINNAGVYQAQRVLTPDGHETTLQVNHLAPFLLTGLLRSALEAAPQGRVVNVSSMAHARGKVVLDDLESARNYEGYAAYAQSKLLNLHFTHELARRLQGTKVTTSALHPGVITTKLLMAGFGSRGASLEKGARTSVYCATAPELSSVSGRYYSDAQETRCAPHAIDPALEQVLWEKSIQMVGGGVA